MARFVVSFEPRIWRGSVALGCGDPTLGQRVAAQRAQSGESRDLTPVGRVASGRDSPAPTNSPISPGSTHDLRKRASRSS
jgi:hypothetical protein